MTSDTSLSIETSQLAQQERRIAALERKVRQFEQQNQMLSSVISGHPAVQRRSALVDPQITSVVQITESLFPESRIEVEMEADPSEPDHPFVVFKVSCGGEMDELLSKETKWSRRVREADSEDPGQLRLLICPV